ncbi:VacJ family lipoprotein [Halochromatium salexigens]|uniref:ABC transporter n=1 Tax=Halochromatium salexigens TaxID=49447 RepID=A0AAJ0XF99_HALSE|nr:VacJ family lipoprotein [Halochromatium salexigens]MBK5930088.1 ABC transporter [Halochromatium salexigens]
MHKAQLRTLPLLLLTVALAVGCGTIPVEQRDPRDPWQAYNRAMFKFNTDFDNAFFKPAAQGYQAITPQPIDQGISNFFNNLADITSAVNNALQFKLSRAGSDVGRLVINTTVGLVGFIDVASNMGIPSYKEDFGQTLGYWGIGDGPYFVMPILGPSSVRDTVGFAGDIIVDPLFNLNEDEIYWGLAVLRAIDARAEFLESGDLMDEAALDRYVFVRDAYLQRRRNLVHDGNPPADEDYDLFWDEDAIEQ